MTEAIGSVVGLGVLDDPRQRASRQAVVVPPLVHDHRMQLHDEFPRAAMRFVSRVRGALTSIIARRGSSRPGSVPRPGRGDPSSGSPMTHSLFPRSRPSASRCIAAAPGPHGDGGIRPRVRHAMGGSSLSSLQFNHVRDSTA